VIAKTCGRCSRDPTTATTGAIVISSAPARLAAAIPTPKAMVLDLDGIMAPISRSAVASCRHRHDGPPR